MPQCDWKALFEIPGRNWKRCPAGATWVSATPAGPINLCEEHFRSAFPSCPEAKGWTLIASVDGDNLRAALDVALEALCEISDPSMDKWPNPREHASNAYARAKSILEKGNDAILENVRLRKEIEMLQAWHFSHHRAEIVKELQMLREANAILNRPKP